MSGRTFGDYLLYDIADAIAKEFPGTTIVRAIGDQYVVMSEDENLYSATVQSRIDTILKTIKSLYKENGKIVWHPSEVHHKPLEQAEKIIDRDDTASFKPVKDGADNRNRIETLRGFHPEVFQIVAELERLGDAELSRESLLF